MSVKPREQLKSSKVIELKAGAFTLPVLQLLRNKPEEIYNQLSEKVEQAPEMFRNAPLAIDVNPLTEDIAPIDFVNLVHKLSTLGIRAIGLRGGAANQQNLARASGLAVLAENRSEVKVAPVMETPIPAQVEQPPQNEETLTSTEASPTKLITQPVRSGQRIYASNTDLIILSTVSAGAEIMADGNIHVYGALRGRALAGVKGDLETRIFCSDLQAELVSIAGQYQISEGIDDSLRGKPVQIHLSNESLVIEEL